MSDACHLAVAGKNSRQPTTMTSDRMQLSGWRLWSLAVAFVLMLAVLATALGYRQLIRSETYSERERMQNLRRILIPAPRGKILDREGRVLVENQPTWRVVIHLAELRREFIRTYREEVRRLRERGEAVPNGFDAEVRALVVQRYLDELNKITGRSEQVNTRNVERHFQQRLLLPFPLMSDLTPVEFSRLLEQLPPGSPMQLSAAARRHYPHGPLAAHVLGYVNAAEVTLEEGEFGEKLATFAFRGTTGAAGLEQTFDDLLQGIPGGEIWMVDHQGRQFRLEESRPPVPGRDLFTSLDLDLQRAAENGLRGLTGAVVAQKISTGEVLAMATSPGYDANEFETNRSATIRRMTEEQAWMNRALQGLYPPGSTFKIITALAGLRHGSLHAGYTHRCEGVMMIGGRQFPCHGRTAHGEIGVIEALRVSCNTFFYALGLEVGVDRIAEEARRFGLHEPTGIELPGEQRRMIVPDRNWKRANTGESWFPGDTANLSIGQGFLRVTPLQMADFMSSFARGEARTRPTILRVPQPEATRDLAPRALTRPERGALDLPPHLVALVTDGMELAVERGTGRLARINGIRIAGKTGTAQVQALGGTLNMAWFIGFAPVENPEIAIAVVIEGRELDVEFAGGRKAAPVARTVFETHFMKQLQRREAAQ